MVKLASALVMAALVLLGSSCGGGGADTEGRISDYVGLDVTHCEKTGEVRQGLPIYNCGFENGDEGCFSVDPDLTIFGVEQYSGGPNCPSAEDSVDVQEPSGETSGEASSGETPTFSFVYTQARKICKRQDFVRHEVGLPPSASDRQFASKVSRVKLGYVNSDFVRGCVSGLKALHQ